MVTALQLMDLAVRFFICIYLQVCFFICNLAILNNNIMKYLNKSFMGLTELDLSNNTDLVVLYCNNNKLKDLDLSNNTKLKWFNLDDNILTDLDLSNNTELCFLSAINNPKLKKIILSKGQDFEIYKDDHTEIIYK